MHEIHKQTRDHHLSANPVESRSAEKQPLESDGLGKHLRHQNCRSPRVFIIHGNQPVAASCDRLTERNSGHKASLWPPTQTPHSDGSKTSIRQLLSGHTNENAWATFGRGRLAVGVPESRAGQYEGCGMQPRRRLLPRLQREVSRR